MLYCHDCVIAVDVYDRYGRSIVGYAIDVYHISVSETGGHRILKHFANCNNSYYRSPLSFYL